MCSLEPCHCCCVFRSLVWVSDVCSHISFRGQAAGSGAWRFSYGWNVNWKDLVYVLLVFILATLLAASVAIGVALPVECFTWLAPLFLLLAVARSRNGIFMLVLVINRLV